MIARSYWAGKRVLVTGGSGFIGSHLVNKLAHKDAEVLIVDQYLRLLDSRNVTLDIPPAFFCEDIFTLDWTNFLNGKNVDVIFHLAGTANVNYSVENPYPDFELNVIASIRLLEALRRITWQGIFIFPSSAAVYGNPAKFPVCEDDPTVPISPYGVGKLSVERYVAIYSKLFGLKAASIRPFSIYGPGQDKLVIYDLLNKINDNPQEISLFGNGEQVRDFLYIKDLINCMMLIVERGKLNGEAYNLASGNGITILELVRLICSILEVHPKLNFSGSVRPGEPEKWTVDITRMKNLGFIASTDMQTGLITTIEWFNAFHRGDRCPD